MSGEQKEVETILHPDFCLGQKCKPPLGVTEDAGNELQLKRGLGSPCKQKFFLIWQTVKLRAISKGHS